MRFPLTFPNEEMRNAIVLLHFHGYLSTNVTSKTKHGSLRRRCALSIKIFSPQAEFSQKIFTAINSGRPLISLTSTRQAKIGNGGTHRERILIRISSQWILHPHPIEKKKRIRWKMDKWPFKKTQFLVHKRGSLLCSLGEPGARPETPKTKIF